MADQFMSIKVASRVSARFRNAIGAVDTIIRRGRDEATSDGKRILRDSIRRSGSIATFDLYNSVTDRVLRNSSRNLWYTKQIFFKRPGSNYARYANDGRAEGKMPFSARLFRWLDAVGLPRRLAFVIARSIGEHGTEGAHFLEDALPKIRANTRKIMERAKALVIQKLGGR